MQLDSALSMGNSGGICEDEEHGGGFDGHKNGSAAFYQNCDSNGAVKEKSLVVTYKLEPLQAVNSYAKSKA
ncbi:hypothetical protein VNO77_30732 [Canavalia gladiata]|uniref:Uncharacterized protein n=1 Tax=Canavalia gladiata TaxID=3824 RepID=A0AAN9KS44_CANGL